MNEIMCNEYYQQFFIKELIPKIIIEPETLGIIDANEAALKFYGYGETLKNFKINDIVMLPEDQIKKAVSQSLKSPQIYYFRHKLASGELRDVEIYTNVITVRSKSYIQLAIIDITERNRIYKELYISENKYKKLFKSMSEAFAYCSIVADEKGSPIDFIILEVNDAFEGFVGVRKEKFINQKCSQVFPDIFTLDFDWVSLLGSIAINGEEHRVEYYSAIIEKWLNISCFSPARGYFVAVISDITSRKLVEASISESHQFLKTVFNTLHINIAILDENAMIIQTNDAWKRSDRNVPFIGMQCRVGMNYFEICSIVEDGGESHAVCEAIANAINDVFLSKTPQAAFEFLYGHYWFRFNVSPFEWPETRRVLVAFEDITSQRMSEEKVKKLSEAVEHSPVAVIITRFDGNVEYVNPRFETLTGYSRDEVLGKNLRILKSGYHDEAFYRELWKTLISGDEWRGEFRNKKKNGEFYWESASITSIKNNAGELTHFVAIKEDITERKKFEALLKNTMQQAEIARRVAEEASAAKSNFLANMSHEIRTPMNSIIGFADVLNNTALTFEQKEILDYIKTSSHFLLSLINDILDLSKIEAGKFEIDNVEFELNKIIEQVISITKGNAAKKGIQFSYVIDMGINFKIEGDANRIRQILLNLVDNAIKFTDRLKSVKLTVSIESDSERSCVILFEVRDEGIGIAEDKISKIFQSFVQSDASITRKYGGTGLGLTISNHLVKLMGGSGISVESAEGSGSVFYFMLKFKKGEKIKSVSKRDVPGIRDTQVQEALKILLVEDNFSNVALTTKVLRKKGHKIEVAVNGIEAVEKSSKDVYDVILMDIQMPEMDGLEATREIRKRGGRVPIIAMTASAMKGDYEACLEAGMDGYIPKPINVYEINETIERILNERKNNACVQNVISTASAIFAKESAADAKAQLDKLTGPAADDEKKIKVFDVERLMMNMGDMKELAVDAVNMFFEYGVLYVIEVKKAIDSGDAESIRRAAHKFKGTSLNASALLTADTLLKIEMAAKDNKVYECPALYEELLKNMDDFKREIELNGFTKI